MQFFNQNKKFLYIYILYAITILVVVLINYDHTSVFMLAVSLVLIASPLAVGIGYKINPNTFYKIVIISMIITGLYSVLQWTIGIEATKIPGLNIAYGDTFEDKPIGYGFNGMEAIKMPSTYQNGNGVALFYLLAIFLIVPWNTNKKIWKIIAISLAIIGIILSGSRSALIPFILLIPYVIKKIYDKLKTKNQKILLLIVFIIGISSTMLYIVYSNSELIEYMYNRYILETINDPTGSGRTTQIQDVLQSITSQDFIMTIKNLLLGVQWNDAIFSEGIFYLISYYGIIIAITFCILLLYPIIKLYKNDKIEVLGLLAVFIAFMVDSSFNYPPALMNYFFIVGVLYQRQKTNQIKLDVSRSKNI